MTETYCTAILTNGSQAEKSATISKDAIACESKI